MVTTAENTNTVRFATMTACGASRAHHLQSGMGCPRRTVHARCTAGPSHSDPGPHPSASFALDICTTFSCIIISANLVLSSSVGTIFVRGVDYRGFLTPRLFGGNQGSHQNACCLVPTNRSELVWWEISHQAKTLIFLTQNPTNSKYLYMSKNIFIRVKLNYLL